MGADVSTSGSQLGQVCHPKGYLEMCCLLGGETGFLSLMFFYLLDCIFLKQYSGPSNTERKVQRVPIYPLSPHMDSLPHCQHPHPTVHLLQLMNPRADVNACVQGWSVSCRAQRSPVGDCGTLPQGSPLPAFEVMGLCTLCWLLC